MAVTTGVKVMVVMKVTGIRVSVLVIIRMWIGMSLS